MKATPALLFIAFASFAHAQPTHRCETRSGQPTFQDRPCAVAVADSSHATHVAAAGPARPPSSGGFSVAGPVREQKGWHNQSRWTRQAKTETQMIAQRLQERTNAAHELQAATFAENHSRCLNAQQVVAICGTPAPAFYCDSRGFVRAPSTSASGHTAVSSGRAFHMQRCALHAKRGG